MRLISKIMDSIVLKMISAKNIELELNKKSTFAFKSLSKHP